jgi:transposase-like protein
MRIDHTFGISNSAPLTVKLSTSIVINCPKCQYQGFATVITGRSAFPIYKCPSCNTVAQSDSLKMKK